MDELNANKKNNSFKAGFLGAIIGSLITAAIIGGIFLVYFNNNTQKSTQMVNGQKVVVNDVNVDSQIEAVAQVVPHSVVGIQTTVVTSTPFGYTDGTAVGSGFIVSADGYIVTNEHVISDSSEKIRVSLQDNSVYDGKVIWSDKSLDLAVLKIDAKNLPPVTFGDSDTIRVGQAAIAIGNPLGLHYERSVTAGIISAINRSLVAENNIIAEDLIQTDATINRGNSGGPLVNGKGEVIGINTYKDAQGEGLGFSLPINIIKPILHKIESTGSFTPLGLGITGYDKQQAIYFIDSADFEKGIYINAVNPGSVAAKSGLKKGDIILTIDGKEVNTLLKLKETLYWKNPGDTVKLTYLRGSSTMETEATLEAR